MLAVVSDTHGSDGHRLRDAALSTVRSADATIHAGDFTTATVLAAFQSTADALYGVHGNADDGTVVDRLPDERVVEACGLTLAVRHRPVGGAAGLSAFGRSVGADVVVFGHTHRPTVHEADGLILLNPGSHADPRGHRPGVATLERTNGRVRGAIQTPDGEAVDAVDVPLD